MTELKKRFQKLVPEHFGGMQHDLMANCELIAQKFAIDFAEWMFINYHNQYKLYQYKDEKGFYTIEKLLEMYKKTLE